MTKLGGGSNKMISFLYITASFVLLIFFVICISSYLHINSTKTVVISNYNKYMIKVLVFSLLYSVLLIIASIMNLKNKLMSYKFNTLIFILWISLLNPFLLSSTWHHLKYGSYFDEQLLLNKKFTISIFLFIITIIIVATYIISYIRQFNVNTNNQRKRYLPCIFFGLSGVAILSIYLSWNYNIYLFFDDLSTLKDIFVPFRYIISYIIAIGVLLILFVKICSGKLYKYKFYIFTHILGIIYSIKWIDYNSTKLAMNYEEAYFYRYVMDYIMDHIFGLAAIIFLSISCVLYLIAYLREIKTINLNPS